MSESIKLPKITSKLVKELMWAKHQIEYNPTLDEWQWTQAAIEFVDRLDEEKEE